MKSTLALWWEGVPPPTQRNIYMLKKLKECKNFPSFKLINPLMAIDLRRIAKFYLLDLSFFLERISTKPFNF